MIYDCFVFFDELEVLDIRLNILDDVVDKFILVEAPFTFSGVPKPLYYQDNKEKFKKFEDKIVARVVLGLEQFKKDENWERERFQRRHIAKVLQEINCLDKDIIMVSDIDEIPRPELIKIYKKEYGIVIAQTLYHYYWLNLQGYWELNIRIGTYDMFKKFGNDGDRFRRLNGVIIGDAGWHFSYLGDLEKVYYKLQSHSHQEFNTPYFMDKNRIQKCIDEGLDLFDRQQYKWKFVKINDWYPRYIVENQEKFKKFIKEI